MAEKQYGMLIYTGRCVGCQTCVVGCKILHECPDGVYLGRLETVGSEENYHVQGTYPNVSVTFRPHLCNHCANPLCVANCPTGAMAKRDEDGIVESDPNVCIGCGTCVQACPYGAPVLDEERGIVRKCDLCRPRIERGEEPLCVASCPAEARVYGLVGDPSDELAALVSERGGEVLLPEEGTEPSVYYC
ncbi:4Fe-4S dicluster domain-containing protein [Rubneribacter sp.]